jgi:hypothetical protein
MEECAKQIRAGDFLHDFEVFLRYVENEKIKLTPKLQFIPLAEDLPRPGLPRWRRA